MSKESVSLGLMQPRYIVSISCKHINMYSPPVRPAANLLQTPQFQPPEKHPKRDSK